MAALARKFFLEATSLASLLMACAGLTACGTLLDLDALKRADCGDDCPAGVDLTPGATGAGATDATGGTYANVGGAKPGGGGTTQQTGGKSTGGGSIGTGGLTGTGGASNMGGVGTAGSDASAGSASQPSDGGSGGSVGGGGICPGGAAPAATWKEHWDSHDQALSLRGYDDCVALYIDDATNDVDTAWLMTFLSKAWTYNISTYGNLGSERLYVVLHISHYSGIRTAVYYEANHDGHNVIDAGAGTWTLHDYNSLGSGLSAVVERTAAAATGKQGSPAAAAWGSAGFAQIYKYDLFQGLGMDDEASQAYDEFSPIPQSYPANGSYWFSDFYYPTWRDHGKTKVLTGVFKLIAKYYPASNGVMPPMNWGQYIHFASGAAGTDLKTQATYAFGWTDTWEKQLKQARIDFPEIKY